MTQTQGLTFKWSKNKIMNDRLKAKLTVVLGPFSSCCQTIAFSHEEEEEAVGNSCNSAGKWPNNYGQQGNLAKTEAEL